MAIVSGGTFRNSSLGEGHAAGPQGISFGGVTGVAGGATVAGTLMTTNFYNGDLQDGDSMIGEMLISLAQGALVSSAGAMNYQMNVLLTTPASAYTGNIHNYALSASGTQSQLYILPFSALRVGSSLYVTTCNIPSGTNGAGSISSVATNQFTVGQGGCKFSNVDFTQPNSLSLTMSISGGDATVVVNCLGGNITRNIS